MIPPKHRLTNTVNAHLDRTGNTNPPHHGNYVYRERGMLFILLHILKSLQLVILTVAVMMRTILAMWEQKYDLKMPVLFVKYSLD